MSKAKTHRRNVIQLYLDNLRKEEKKPDTRGERGQAKDARRRAMDVTAEMCSYKDYTSVARCVRAWEDSNTPVNFDTMGMELDQEFATIVREQQCKVDAACAATRALAKQVRGLDFGTERLDELEGDLVAVYPRCICHSCKGAVDHCVMCDGTSWIPELPRKVDPRLLDAENIHVVYKGEIVLLDEVPQ